MFTVDLPYRRAIKQQKQDGYFELNTDIAEWTYFTLEKYVHEPEAKCSYDIHCIGGPCEPKFIARFTFKDVDQALLFKLTFGGE